jgi:hypothetical protein
MRVVPGYSLDSSARMYEKLEQFVKQEFASYYLAKTGRSARLSSMETYVQRSLDIPVVTYAYLKYKGTVYSPRKHGVAPASSDAEAYRALAEAFDKLRAEVYREKAFNLRLVMAISGKS